MQAPKFQFQKIPTRYAAGMWHHRLLTAMDRRGWNAADLARESGVPYESVVKYTLGGVENPRGNRMSAMAKALGVPIAWLRSPEPLVSGFDPDRELPPEEQFDPAIVGPHDEFDPAATPRLAELPAGATAELAAQGGMGSGQVISVSYHRRGEEIVTQDEIKPDYWHFPQDFSRYVLGAPPDKMLVVECRGDSMEPTIMSGERVWVNTLHRRPSPDGIYALRDTLGEIVIKRLEIIVGTMPPRLRIISDNPKHPPQEVAIDDIGIIGKVRCGLRMF